MNDLDKAIEKFNFNMNMSICVEETDFNKGVRDLLVELKRLRRSQMQPAVKYMCNTTQKQFKHMRSELAEIKENLYCYQNSNVGPGVVFIKDDLIKEVIDLQFSCQTMLEGPLGLSKDQIADYVQMVVKKNADRKYDIAE